MRRSARRHTDRATCSAAAHGPPDCAAMAPMVSGCAVGGCSGTPVRAHRQDELRQRRQLRVHRVDPRLEDIHLAGIEGDALNALLVGRRAGRRDVRADILQRALDRDQPRRQITVDGAALLDGEPVHGPRQRGVPADADTGVRLVARSESPTAAPRRAPESRRELVRRAECLKDRIVLRSTLQRIETTRA